MASWGSETATANVARASDTPASLSAGIPNRTPTIPVISPAIGIVKIGRIPSPIGSQSGGSNSSASSPGLPSDSTAPT